LFFFKVFKFLYYLDSTCIIMMFIYLHPQVFLCIAAALAVAAAAPQYHTPVVAPYHAPVVAPYHAPVVHAAPYHAPVVHAAPVIAHAPAYKAAPEVYPDEVSPYTYTYAVADDYSKSNFKASETSDGAGNAEGSYTVALPDGRIQTVNYKSDGYNGYVADVSYEGTPVYPEAKPYAPVPAPAYQG
jgi:hypothetical protein